MAQQWPQFGKSSQEVGEMTDKARKEIEELRQEAARERIPASQAIAELIKHCQEYKKNDPLINGQLSEPGGNPFIPKKTCVLL